MAAKRKNDRKGTSGQRPRDPSPPSASALKARKVPGDEAWELVHPRCARDRAEDLEEVRKMIEAGEQEIALDELRWLLNGCSDFIDAHLLLGELAMLEHDAPLARGHFGYAFQLGSKAMQKAPANARFPYRLPANQSFYEAAKGLAWSLKQLGKTPLAQEVLEHALRYDPTDPLAIQALVAEPEPPPQPPKLPAEKGQAAGQPPTDRQAR